MKQTRTQDTTKKMSFFKKIGREYILHTYQKGVQKSGRRRKKITRNTFMPKWKDKTISSI